jgi:hypothetical protein
MKKYMAAALAMIAAAIGFSLISAAPSGADVTGYEIVWQRSGNISSGNDGDTTANCPSGKNAVGGGYLAGGNTVDFKVYLSSPDEVTTNHYGWRVIARNDDASTRYFDVYAVCATVS